MKIRSVEAELFNADRQTDGRTKRHDEANSHVLAILRTRLKTSGSEKKNFQSVCTIECSTIYLKYRRLKPNLFQLNSVLTYEHCIRKHHTLRRSFLFNTSAFELRMAFDHTIIQLNVLNNLATHNY